MDTQVLFVHERLDQITVTVRSASLMVVLHEIT